MIPSTMKSHRSSNHYSSNLIVLLTCFALSYACTPSRSSENASEISDTYSYTGYVNSFIGTDGVGNTQPGTAQPFGMVSIVPQTFDFTKTHMPTGYRQGQDTIYAFSVLNLSGVGCPGAGSIPFKFSSGAFDVNSFGSTFKEEEASPGFYSVKLTNENIHVKATSTIRSGIFELALPAGKNNIYIDLTSQQGHVKGGEILNYDDQSVNGYQLDGFFCGAPNMLNVYFHTEFQQQADSTFLMYNNKSNEFEQGLDEKPSGIVYSFNNEAQTKLLIKFGISFVSIENAKNNLNQEQSNFEFEKIRNESLIEIDSTSLVLNRLDKKAIQLKESLSNPKELKINFEGS